MKNLLILVVLATTIISCKIDKEKSGELPDIDIDVDADAGALPEYDVDWADINVGTKTRTVKIPKVVVVMEEEEVEVPFIDMDMPGEDKSERSLVVEAEVSGKEHQLDIQEIRASNKKLYVISMLKELSTDLGGKTIRIQDQVDINAPDLDVQHIIVGRKADRVFNNNYHYVNSISDLSDKVKNAKIIYTE